MGLDMYFTKSTYVGANFEHNKITGKISLKRDGKPIEIQLNRVATIEENFAYWRKANAIHRWFVENVQEYDDNCARYYVDEDNIKELIHACEQVLNDHSLAAEILPCQEGFFFGGNEYDESYFEDVKYTLEKMKEALNEPADYYYQSSW